MISRRVFAMLLRLSGFTTREAWGIFHEHIAPLNEEGRQEAMRLLNSRGFKKDSWEGRALLKDCPGI